VRGLGSRLDPQPYAPGCRWRDLSLLAAVLFLAEGSNAPRMTTNNTASRAPVEELVGFVLRQKSHLGVVRKRQVFPTSVMRKPPGHAGVVITCLKRDTPLLSSLLTVAVARDPVIPPVADEPLNAVVSSAKPLSDPLPTFERQVPRKLEAYWRDDHAVEAAEQIYAWNGCAGAHDGGSFCAANREGIYRATAASLTGS